MNYKPLALILEPKTLDELYGQKMIEKSQPIRRLIEAGTIPSVVITGPSGIGKTTFAKIIANKFDLPFIKFNASDFSSSDIKKSLEAASEFHEQSGRRSIFFIDEIHRATRPKIELFLDAMDKSISVIGASTENPFYSLPPAFRSRTYLLRFNNLDKSVIYKIMKNAEQFLSINITDEAKKLLCKIAEGDARKLLNRIQAANTIHQGIKIESKDIIVGETGNYDKKESHYDVISAFIKSVRGTDPDSALLWLAKMIKGGEDPLFIARRLMILSVEDIAMANALAAPVAAASYEIIKAVGMPEAEIALSYLTIFLATSPKSNSSYSAYNKAKNFVNDNQFDVPPELRQNPPKGTIKYKYPHNYPRHYVKNRYSPLNVNFYTTGDEGYEARVKRFLKELHK